MTLAGFLARLTGIFEELGLDYMIVGSLASRATEAQGRLD